MHSSRPHGGRAAADGGYILAVFLAASGLFAGCVADWEIASLTQPAADDDGCPEWACGSNTAVVNNTPVVELNRDGAAGDGFRILSFHDWPLLTLLDLDIEGGELVGTGLLGVEYRELDQAGGGASCAPQTAKHTIAASTQAKHAARQSDLAALLVLGAG